VSSGGSCRSVAVPDWTYHAEHEDTEETSLLEFDPESHVMKQTIGLAIEMTPHMAHLCRSEPPLQPGENRIPGKHMFEQHDFTIGFAHA
jgi:hypothetical protein